MNAQTEFATEQQARSWRLERLKERLSGTFISMAEKRRVEAEVRSLEKQVGGNHVKSNG